MGPLSAGAGRQGARLSNWACTQLPYERVSGMAPWLLARRSLREPTECADYRAFGPAATSVTTLVRIAGRRWASEASFADAKGVVGLDHYEVRKWMAWYRHFTLVLLAHAHLEVSRYLADRDEGQEGGRPTDCRSRCRRCGACCSCWTSPRSDGPRAWRGLSFAVTTKPLPNVVMPRGVPATNHPSLATRRSSFGPSVVER